MASESIPPARSYNGAKIDGAVALRNMLTSQPEIFVGVMTEKLLTYALGRGVAVLRYADRPQDRPRCGKQIIRFSSLVMGIVKSTPFEMKVKKSQPGDATVRI